MENAERNRASMPNNSKRRREAKAFKHGYGNDINKIFFGQGTEPLTDELIQELVAKSPSDGKNKTCVR